MKVQISEYAESMISEVKHFNRRLKEGGMEVQFPESSVSTWLPRVEGRKLYQEQFLAMDVRGAVRGAYILKHQDFLINNRVMSLGDIRLPISEGIINHAYPHVGVSLLFDALRRQPLLFGLGIGGYEEVSARFYKAARWTMFSVPFFFRVLHPFAFLRNMTYLRRSAVRRLALDALALSGLGWLGIRGVQTFCIRKIRPKSKIQVELAEEFSDWADEIWNACKDQYGFSAVRDAETLRILYPKDNPKFLRLKISEGSRPIGWAVTLNTLLSNHKQLGNMRLGSIVDGFSSISDAAKVVRAASMFLHSQNVDLILSNQAHAAWQHGLRQAGFLPGPSNFIFATSPKLSELLRQNQLRNDDLHLNRGDGDGPINL